MKMKMKRLVLFRACGMITIEDVSYDSETSVLDYKIAYAPDNWDRDEDYDLEDDIVLVLKQ